MVEQAKTLYVAGPVSGTTDYSERFRQGCMEVAQLGYVPVSPLEVFTSEDTTSEETWQLAIRADIRALLECHGAFMLRNWEDSRGARLEHYIAVSLDMLVLYQGDVEK